MHSFCFFLGALCFVTQIYLFSVKNEVTLLEKEYALVQHYIQKAQEDLHLLKAEWAHLNEPQRLEYLAQKYLKQVGPISGNQLISIKNERLYNFDNDFQKELDHLLEKENNLETRYNKISLNQERKDNLKKYIVSKKNKEKKKTNIETLIAQIEE
jgi:cell division protein FtsL